MNSMNFEYARVGRFLPNCYIMTSAVKCCDGLGSQAVHQPEERRQRHFSNQHELTINCSNIISIKVAAKSSVIFGCLSHCGGSET